VTHNPITIKTVATSLSDGSEVFDIAVIQEGRMLLNLPCVSLDDATSFASGLKELIDSHTNETVRFL